MRIKRSIWDMDIVEGTHHLLPYIIILTFICFIFAFKRGLI